MPRPMWTGSLSFGLVNVPVQVAPATRDNDVRFHMVRQVDGKAKPERVQTERVAEDGKPVPWSKVGKGWELDDGRMLVLTQKDLDAAAPERTRTIDIEQFVALGDIDPILFDHPYWLLPAGEGDGAVRAYSLLLRVLEEAGEVGIGRIVLRNKEQLVALRAQDGLLSLTTMKFAEDIRDPADTGAVPGGKQGEPTKAEVRDAVALIEEMTDTWQPESFEDRHRARLLDLIAQKKKSGTVEIPEAEPQPMPTKAPADLMAALEESLARARGDKKPRTKAGEKARA